jgi:predicted HicB family RNase H-like nuclease
MKKQETEQTAAGQEKPVFNQIAYQNEFNRKKYDRINLIMQKGKKERVRVAAAAAGQSVNEYINVAIDRALNADTAAAE